MDVPSKIFGMPVTVEGKVRLKGYPNAYISAYSCSNASIGKTPCLIFEPKSAVKPLQVEKMFQAVSTGEEKPCILVTPLLTAYQRSSLSERGIAWLKSERTFHIPFLAASCDEPRDDRRPSSTFSAGAQLVALRAIDGSWDRMTSTEVAKRMGKSLSSVSAYFAQVAAVEPSLIASKGRTRYIVSPVSATEKRAAFERLEARMSSPVKRRELIVCNEDTKATLSKLPVSGVSALSKHTMIAPDAWSTKATAARDKKTLAAVSNLPRLDSRDEGVPDAELEIWAYKPEESDLLSLYLDTKALAAEEDDERLAQAAQDLKEKIFNER